jgi:hypothetical protein
VEECLFHVATPYWSRSESGAHHGKGVHVALDARNAHHIMPQSSDSDLWHKVDDVVGWWRRGLVLSLPLGRVWTNSLLFIPKSK